MKTDFFEIKGFPDVLGIMDCVHVPIISPGGPKSEFYRNRKGWMSLNIQAITGPQLQIFDIVIRWPGSTHDSRIFDNSAAKVRLESGELQGILLGDAGYKQTSYLYTPVSTPQSEPEARYNFAHKATRNTVERAFGVMKRRFPCLCRKLGNHLQTTTRIIAACAVLHNLGRLWDPRDFPLDIHIDTNLRIETDRIPEYNRGNAIKHAFIERHFTN